MIWGRKSVKKRPRNVKIRGTTWKNEDSRERRKQITLLHLARTQKFKQRRNERARKYLDT
jgi:hypothetical protein